MSGFVFFALVLTFVYVVYFSVMITLDLHGKKDEKESEEDTYDVGDMTNEEQRVACSQRQFPLNTGYEAPSNRLHIIYADMLRRYNKLVFVAVLQSRSQSVPACRIDARQRGIAET